MPLEFEAAPVSTVAEKSYHCFQRPEKNVRQNTAGKIHNYLMVQILVPNSVSFYIFIFVGKKRVAFRSHLLM